MNNLFILPIITTSVSIKINALSILLIFKPIPRIQLPVLILAYAHPVSSLAMSHVLFPVALILVFVVVNFDSVAFLLIVLPVAYELLRGGPSFPFDLAVLVLGLFLHPVDCLLRAVFLSLAVVPIKLV